jgi:fatty acid CoA ligase FadD36
VAAPSSLFGAIDRSDDRVSVSVGGAGLRRGELFAAAASVADRVHGAPVVAVHAEATLSTVVAVLGCLLAGVPLVPVPPDSGPKERAHVLRDSGAALWLARRSCRSTRPPVRAAPGRCRRPTAPR